MRPHLEFRLQLTTRASEVSHPTMIAGINKVFLHEGREFHLQAEDLGLDKACFEAKVYEQGVVLWLKRLPYSKVVEQNLPLLEQNKALKALIEKSMQTLEAAIARGRFG